MCQKPFGTVDGLESISVRMVASKPNSQSFMPCGFSENRIAFSPSLARRCYRQRDTRLLDRGSQTDADPCGGLLGQQIFLDRLGRDGERRTGGIHLDCQRFFAVLKRKPPIVFPLKLAERNNGRLKRLRLVAAHLVRHLPVSYTHLTLPTN